MGAATAVEEVGNWIHQGKTYEYISTLLSSRVGCKKVCQKEIYDCIATEMTLAEIPFTGKTLLIKSSLMAEARRVLIPTS